MDEKPGAPSTDPIKPKPSSEEERMSFSFGSLTFIDAYTVDNRKYVRYFVTEGESYYVEFIKIEFIEYYNLYTDKLSEAIENGMCLCDETSPLMDYIEDVVMTITVVNKEKETEDEIEESIPCYFATDLCQNFKMSIHGSHKKD